MHAIIEKLGFDNAKHCADAEQGFVDQWGEFLSREEAFVVASDMEQLLAEPHISGCLFSEDLY